MTGTDLLTGESFTYVADRIFFTELLESRTPFAFTRFGDGEFECMAGNSGRNWDGCDYSPEFMIALIDSFQFLSRQPNVYLAQRCPPRLRSKISEVINLNGNRYYDAEALIFHNITPELGPFYRALIDDPRRKVLVGPQEHYGANKLLGCELQIQVRRPNAFQDRDATRACLIAEHKPDTVFLFCAGMTAKVLIADLLKYGPDITCIDLGSALDPIYIGRTRSDQPARRVVIDFFTRMGFAP